MIGKRIRQLEELKNIDIAHTYIAVDSSTLQEAQKVSIQDLVLSRVSGVQSFNNRIGKVVSQSGDYDKTMVGLSNVENLSPSEMPISKATQHVVDGINHALAVLKEQNEYIGAIENSSITDIQIDLTNFVKTEMGRPPEKGDLVNILNVPYGGTTKTQQWRFDITLWGLYNDNMGSIAPATKTSIGFVSIGDGIEIDTEGEISSPLAISSLQANSALNNNVVDFTEAIVKENIDTGEKLPILFGKLKKWLSLIKSAAFMDVSDFSTAQQGLLAETAIQTAKIGSTPVQKSGTELIFPEMENSRLSELDDVALTTLKAGEILSWTGNGWTNKEVVSPTGGVGKYVATLGNGVTKLFVVNHNLNTLSIDVVATISEKPIWLEYTTTSVNQITFTLDVAPATDTLKITVLG